MLFYLFVSILSICLYKFAESRGKPLVFFIAILPPVLIEGLRDQTIGIDMQTYVVPFFLTLSRANDVFEVPELIDHSDYGYLYLTYFFAKYVGDLNVFLTFFAVMKLVPVYYTAYIQRERINSALFLFAYFMYYYVQGFSMMRQSLAISLCIFSLNFFFLKQFKKYYLCVFIAYFFHNSAVLMLYLPLIYYFGKSKYKYLFSLLVPIFIFFQIENIMESLIDSPLFTEGKVVGYMDSGVETEKTSILIAVYILFFGFFLFFRTLWKRIFSKDDSEEVVEGTVSDELQAESSTGELMGKDCEDDVSDLSLDPYDVYNWDLRYLMLTSIAYAIIFLLLASYIEVAFRMSFYMMNVAVFTMLILLKKEKGIVFDFGLLLLFLLHFVIACNHGNNGTIPYQSIILQI